MTGFDVCILLAWLLWSIMWSRACCRAVDDMPYMSLSGFLVIWTGLMLWWPLIWWQCRHAPRNQE